MIGVCRGADDSSLDGARFAPDGCRRIEYAGGGLLTESYSTEPPAMLVPAIVPVTTALSR